MNIDKEKIINGLRCHAGCEQGFDCDDCEYLGDGDCSERLAKDALSLINEQANDMHHMGLIIEEYEHELAITQDNLNYYINGND